ncbi:MAG: trimethylamine methyltransferase family protein [Desulfobacterales bacterium]|nr:MAG: trimethylamine methyltransferase family protein [Desulfobacterales bacterium]
MNLKGLAGGLYQPLSPEDIKTIHEASLTILEKTGITFESGLDQNDRETWNEKGSQDTRTRAREIAKQILAEEEKSYIRAEVEQAIRGKYEILL